MPFEPTQGRPDQVYLFQAVQNYNDFLVNKLLLPQTLPNPEPSEPFNVLLHRLAQGVSDSLPGLPPPSPCTDNRYWQNIAQNLNWMAPTIPVGAGRPDQVYIRLIDQFLYHYVTTVLGGTPAMDSPNPADTENRLLMKLASLTYELDFFYP